MTTPTLCAESIESGLSAIAIGNEDQGRRRVRTRVENMQTAKSTKAKLSNALPTLRASQVLIDKIQNRKYFSVSKYIYIELP